MNSFKEFLGLLFLVGLYIFGVFMGHKSAERACRANMLLYGVEHKLNAQDVTKLQEVVCDR